MSGFSTRDRWATNNDQAVCRPGARGGGRMTDHAVVNDILPLRALPHLRAYKPPPMTMTFPFDVPTPASSYVTTRFIPARDALPRDNCRRRGVAGDRLFVSTAVSLPYCLRQTSRLLYPSTALVATFGRYRGVQDFHRFVADTAVAVFTSTAIATA